MRRICAARSAMSGAVAFACGRRRTRPAARLEGLVNGPREERGGSKTDEVRSHSGGTYVPVPRLIPFHLFPGGRRSSLRP
jgi:hypothetical protein